jgi:hypothetical protein
MKKNYARKSKERKENYHLIDLMWQNVFVDFISRLFLCRFSELLHVHKKCLCVSSLSIDIGVNNSLFYVCLHYTR